MGLHLDAAEGVAVKAPTATPSPPTTTPRRALQPAPSSQCRLLGRQSPLTTCITVTTDHLVVSHH